MFDSEVETFDDLEELYEEMPDIIISEKLGELRYVIEPLYRIEHQALIDLTSSLSARPGAEQHLAEMLRRWQRMTD